ncbi:MAG: hypothetical protein RhofKO_22460 [Rhodothermales bacterium]
MPTSNISLDKIEVLASLQDLDASEETWAEIRQLLADFFAQRAADRAAAIADEQGWTEEDFHRLARTHVRTPYRS